MLRPAWAAWLVFVTALQLGSWSSCFFHNRLAATLFLRAHRDHFGAGDPIRINPTAVTELSHANYSYEALRHSGVERASLTGRRVVTCGRLT